MGLIEIACLAVAAIIMAADQALKGTPAFRAWLPRLPGWVNYLPLILVLTAGGVWLMRELSPTQPAASAGAIQKTPGGATISAPSAPVGYVPQAIAAKFLGLYADASAIGPTPLQVDALLHPYIGRRMRISGVLDSIEVQKDGSLWVQMSAANLSSSFFVTFPKKWTQQLSALSAGAAINVDTLVTDGEPPDLTDSQLF